VSMLTGDLAGKQVWHITAPASADVLAIKKLSQGDIDSGRPVLTSNGKQYSLLCDPPSSKSLLVPSHDDNAYVPMRSTFTHTYHLGEVLNPPVAKDAKGRRVNFHAQPAENENEICAGVPKKWKTPAQRAGLKMRYQPFGLEPLSSTVARKAIQPDSDPDAEFTVPPQVPTAVEERHGETPKLKKKKKKKHLSDHAATDVERAGAADIDDSERRPGIANESSQTLPDLTLDLSKPAGVATAIDADSAKKKKEKTKRKSRIES
jgi:hypothetical protein